MYKTLVVDPPWRYRSPGWKGGARNHYPTLPTEVLETLPIPEIAAPDAHLWLWCTDTFEEDALHLIKQWGFTKKATWVWIKLTKNPLGARQLATYRERGWPIIEYEGRLHGQQWGNGYYGRGDSEFLMLAVRGKNMVDHRARQVRKSVVAPVGVHSEKPERAYDLIRHYSPEPRIELFARTRRYGFDVWGNEVESEHTLLDQWGKRAETYSL